ncbi:MAG: aminotransferase, partial [Desulfofustis sp.]|nr:aminotransferase [Desulfofustis sp.]
GGGCVAFPKYLGSGSADQFCEDLVAESGVLLLPPRIFHSELLNTPGNRFRIGYGRRNMAGGLNAFRNYLRSFVR